MCGNGAVIGMEIIARHRRLIPPDQPQAPSACTVAVAGTTVRSTAECRIATAAIPSFATTTLGSVW